MPLMDALILTAICIAFVGFALLLAWGDYKTRNPKPGRHTQIERIDWQICHVLSASMFARV